MIATLPFYLAIAGVPARTAAAPAPAIDILVTLVATVVIALLVMGVVCYANRFRFMATAPSTDWVNPAYIKQLPNILHAMREAGCPTAWPHEATPLGALAFRRQLTRIFKNKFPDAKTLVHQHMSLWVFVELHHYDLYEKLLKCQILRTRSLFLAAVNADLRDHLLGRISFCRRQYDAVRQLPAAALTQDSVPWLDRFLALNVLFVEQGYSLHPQLSKLLRWQSASNDEVLHDIAIEDNLVTMMNS